MTKHYCDICGKEVEHITEYMMPDWNNEYLLDCNGHKLKRINAIVPTKMDICTECSIDIRNLIGRYQAALTNKIDVVTMTLIQRR